jgi:hypothetical protein
VEVLAGAYMMVRRDVLEATGGFDEQFFMYGEDVDLSYRIRLLGYKNWYLADSPIIHFKGESTRKDTRYVLMFYKAMALFVKKHYGRRSAWYPFLLQAAIRARAGLSFISRLFRSGGQPVKTPPLPLLIIGDPQTIGEVQIILGKNNYAATSEQHAVPGDDTQSLVRDYGIGEIIYCAGPLSYSDIIWRVQALPVSVYARFHAAGSHSIVGSQAKNTGGEALGYMEGNA